MTPKEAAAALKKFREQRPKIVLKVLNEALRYGLKQAVTFHMEPLGRGEDAQPPNPPPGPLGIRSGKLRRATGMIPGTQTGGGYSGGLKYDLTAAPYGAIHEYGGRTKAHEIKVKNKKALHWIDDTGADRFAIRVMHPGSDIPARPVLQPALKDAERYFYDRLEVESDRLARQLLP